GGFVVTTSNGPLQAFELMDDSSFDVIVSDYQMPEMDGIQFLKRLRATDMTKPFIIFTGKGREEVVIEALNYGADFYIQKGGHAKSQFAELAANIRYAYGRRKAESVALQQSKAMEASIDGISILDGAFKHLYANRSYLQIFGYKSMDELKFTDFRGLFQDGPSLFHSIITDSAVTGRFKGQVMGSRNDGTEIPLDISMAMLDDGGSVVVARDISEKKQAESDIKRQSENINIVNEVITYSNQATDLRTLMSSTLSSTLNFLGFESGGIYLLDKSREKAELKHHVNLSEEFLAMVGTIHDDNPTFHDVFVDGEMIVVDEDSSRDDIPPGFFETLAFVPLFSRTTITGALVVANHEIQKVIDLERQALMSIGRELGTAISRLSTEMESDRVRTNLQTLFDGMDEMVFIMDRECRILETNESAIRHLGFSSDHLKDMKMTSLMHPDSMAEAQASLQEILEGKKTLCDIPLLTAEGDLLNIETNISIATWNGRQVLVGVSRDIGQRIRYEEALKESELFSQSLMDSIPAHIFLYDDKGKILYLNPFAAEQLGYDANELIDQNLLMLIPEENKELVINYHRLQREGHDIDNYDVEIFRRDGEKRIMNASSRRVKYRGKESNLAVLIDVTDVRRTAEKWKRSDELYRLISDYTSDVIWMMDLQGRFTYVSPSVVQLRGFTPDEVLAQSIDEIASPASMEMVKSSMQEAMRLLSKGEIPDPFRIEIEQPKKDGGNVWTEAIIQVSLNEDGTPNGFIGVSRNIEQRRRTQERLEDSEEMHRLLIENSHDIIYTLDSQGVFTFVSPSWKELLGHGTDEVVGKPFPPFVHPDDVGKCLDFLNTVLSTGQRRSGLEYRVRHKNGEYRWHTSAGAVLKDKDGNPIGIEGIARDITEKKMAEIVVEDSRDRFRALFTDSPVSIMIMDIDTLELINANQAALKFYGAKNMLELKSHSFWSEPPYSMEEARILADRAVNEGLQRFEWKSPRLDGEKHWELVDVDTIILDGVRRLLVTSVDITEQKHYNDALKLANKKLQLLSSITRHDINNQLAVVLGYIDLLQSSTDTSRCQDFMGKIGKAADTIERHIRFTKEYEMLGLEAPDWHEVSDLLDLDHDDSIHIVDSCQGLHVRADPMLSRVFENLLDNSMRHGEGVESIVVNYEIKGNLCHLYWQDDGVGVPQDMKERIFLRGVGKNTGFGLFLSREILDITGITIVEDGVPDKGARFHMTIPEGAWKQD
ncbi:MAG: PAS domain S-box protein, partial [Candidatus Methanomethylophilaceae archaeon]|nr:PAS domain S-box protein [Candidatus Methanomethylophilaceae archaeon]